MRWAVVAWLAAAAVFLGWPFASVARADEAPPPAPPTSPDVRLVPLPDTSFTFRQERAQPSLAWAVLQMIPSPQMAFGRQRHIDADGTVHHGLPTAFGLRWQLTPILWSFGMNRRQSPWRLFVVDPLARQSGSVELFTVFDYFGGDVDALLVRPGARVYLPLVHRGEYLSVSLGTSVYRSTGLFRVAYETGIYTLSGFLGLQVTAAPSHQPLALITTIRIRYF
jgi:hypothetical protein